MPQKVRQSQGKGGILVNTEEIGSLVKATREYFYSGATLDVERRIWALRRLKASIIKHEAEIADALRADLGKSGFEGYTVSYTHLDVYKRQISAYGEEEAQNILAQIYTNAGPHIEESGT